MNGVVSQVRYQKSRKVLISSPPLVSIKGKDSDLGRLQETDDDMNSRCLNEKNCGDSIKTTNIFQVLHSLKEMIVVDVSSVFFKKDKGIVDTAIQVFEVMPHRNLGSGMAIFRQGFISEFIGFVDFFTNQPTLDKDVNTMWIVVISSLESEVWSYSLLGVFLLDFQAESLQWIVRGIFLRLDYKEILFVRSILVGLLSRKGVCNVRHLVNEIGFSNIKEKTMVGRSLDKCHMFDGMTGRAFEDPAGAETKGLKGIAIHVFDGLPQVVTKSTDECITMCCGCSCLLNSWSFVSSTVESTWVGIQEMQRSNSWQIVWLKEEGGYVNGNCLVEFVCEDVVGAHLEDNGTSRPGCADWWSRVVVH